jgi:hypothetical protein
MKTLTLMLKRIDRGWAIMLTDGRELIRFTGLGSRRRALRYLLGHDAVREAAHGG